MFLRLNDPETFNLLSFVRFMKVSRTIYSICEVFTSYHRNDNNIKKVTHYSTINRM